MEASGIREEMLDSCIQPEVILIEEEGTNESNICSVDEPLNSGRRAIEGELRGSTVMIGLTPGTIPLPHLLNEGGSWQEGNLVGVELGSDVNGQEIDEEVGEEDLNGYEDPNVDVETEDMKLKESHEVQQQRPNLRPRGRPAKKRGRKGLPRKAGITATHSRQIDVDNYTTNYETELENPNLFQVALKMTMRTSDERKSRIPLNVPMPVVKRASLSLQDKVNIIQELATGEKQSSICKKQGLPKSTVQSIWKNREKIQGAIEKIGMNRKRCRRAQHEDVEDKLVEWINNLKAQSVPVNGPQLRAKAQVMAKAMGLTEFRCSTGWLDKFKTRHRIIFKKAKTSPKNMAAGDRKIALDWVTKVWPALCEGYPPSDIFNVDETGVFFRAPPDKAHRLRNETCQNGKMSKERITVLLCTNSEGTEKLKLNAIGNILHPRSFEGISNLENLPTAWHYNGSSWITRDIFISWLRNWDELLRSTDRQIILILDNSPAHATTEQFTNIKLVFLPLVVANILQPLEHGVISRFKLHYRRLLLDRMVRKAELGVSRTISILEAVTMLGTAWTEVNPDLITDCFRLSNLQSLMVPDMGIGSSGAANDYEMILADEPKLLQEAIRVGIPIPDNVSFKEYALIDSSLHVTDYINDSASDPLDQGTGCSLGDTELVEEEFVQQVEVPLQREVQGFIDAIRNWAMMSTANCDTSIHTALSVLESYALKAKPRDLVGRSTVTEIDVDVGLSSKQDIPVSVIISSQNGTSNGGLGSDHGSNNLTLTAFGASSQQMVQIPISIHSQSTELVTLTPLEPSPPDDLDRLELRDQDPLSTDTTEHTEETHVQQTIHFQHQQHQPQFFAYLG